MTLKIILLLVVACINFVLGSYFNFRSKQDSASKPMGVLAWFLGIWTLSIAMFYATDSLESALSWDRLGYMAATICGAVFWVFSTRIGKTRIKPHVIFIALIPTAVLTLFHLSPNFLLSHAVQHDWGREVILVPWHYWIFFTHFVLFFGSGFIVFAHKYLASSGVNKNQFKYIFIGVIITSFFCILFNLVLPSPVFFNWKLGWLGPLFTIFFSGSAVFTIVKYSTANWYPYIKYISNNLLPALFSIVSVLLLDWILFTKILPNINPIFSKTILLVFVILIFRLFQYLFNKAKINNSLNDLGT